jgi:hypothetical protein
MSKTDDDLSKDTRYLAMLLEQMSGQNKAILEAMGDIQYKVTGLPTREEFNELKQDVEIIKAAVTDTSRQVHDHERRITRLEAV